MSGTQAHLPFIALFMPSTKLTNQVILPAVQRAFLLGALSSVFLLRTPLLLAEDRQAPETIESGSSCLAEQCHGTLLSGATVHGPLDEGDDSCELCHEADGNRHIFSYPATGTELCYNCHDSVTEKKMVHYPLKDKGRPCTICHNPHSSSNKKLLNFETTNDLCLSCHDDLAEGGLYHDAEKIDACTACHEPHSSDKASQLRAKAPALCYSCHRDMKEQMAGDATVHGPVSMGCTSCHDAHRKLTGKGLAKTSPDLCVDCHEDFEPTVAEMSARHRLLLEGENCGRCHNPHAGKGEYLLLGDSQSLCLSCHSKAIKLADGRVISSLEEVLAEGVHRHGSGKSLDCAACHQPHANKQHSFLRGAYPQTFYSPYSAEAYGLCFTCHDESLAADAQTAEATEFRDAQINLHYVHVNKARKGRTCRACHAWHVSRNPQMLRDSVPFGEWQIPMNFRANENGGSCSPGCHRRKTYSRTKAASDTTSVVQPLPETSTVAPETDAAE